MKILAVTNNKTQILKSPSDLSVISSRDHNFKQASTDISFFSSHRSVKHAFAQIYKNSDIVEIWNIKNEKSKNLDEDVDRFERIYKLSLEGVQAVTSAKNTDGVPEFAVGYSNGKITMMDLNKRPKIDFPTDAKKASVICMDINNNNQLLASVYENGSISVFGLKTNVRTTQINDVKEATFVRFHPSERYQMAIASYSGSVSLYKIDNNVNKLIFQKQAHEAPCRDISMSEETPNRLFTCGCDSVIKIFDIRHKATGLQIQLDCGFTSISTDVSGQYIVAGNLKGSVIGFDVRNLKQQLAQTSVDNDLITRVAFFPQSDNSYDRMSMYKTSQQSVDVEDLPEAPEIETKDIIESIQDYCRGRVSEIDFSYNPRISSIGPTDCNDISISGRQSDYFGKALKNALSEVDLNCDDEKEEQIFQSHKPKDRKSVSKQRRSSYLTVNSPLHRIHEESNDKENEKFYTPVASKPRYSSTPSTPATAVKIKHNVTLVRGSHDDSDEVIEVEEVETPKPKPTQKIENMQIPVPTLPPQNIDMSRQFEKFQESIEQIVKNQVQSLNMDLYQRHIEMSYHVTEQRTKLQERMQMIEDCMAMLMNDDYKINRVLELQKENDILRGDVKSLMKTINEMTAQATQSETLQ